MPIYQLRERRPRIAPSAYIHPTAVIIGDVTIGELCWIGPNCTLRGDMDAIVVGDGTAVQDNCVIHGQTVLAANANLGHGCVVHGARVGENVLIANGAVVLDGAVIGDGAVVAAGSVVAPKAVVPPGKMVMGVPAAIVGDRPAQGRGIYRPTPERGYPLLARQYREGLKELTLEEATAL